MPVQFETFSQEKIDRLRNSLEVAASKGRPKSFEIWVDGLQVIPRTEDTSDFDRYEDALTADSQQIKVVIYCTDKTNRNDKYFYALKAENTEQAIEMGIAGMPVKSFNSRDIDHWRQKQVVKNEQSRHIAELKSKIGELNRELAEREEYIKEVEDALEKAEANKNTLRGFDLGALLGKGLESLIRNTASTWGKVPGLSGFAEVVEQENQDKVAAGSKPDEQAQASITKKKENSDGVILTDQEKQLLSFFKELQRVFSIVEFEQVIAILDLLSKEKSELDIVLSHLKEQDQEQAGEQNS